MWLDNSLDESECNGVLQITTEMYQEEKALLNYSDVGLLEDSLL